MTMDGLLSLQWNNHASSFLKQLSFLRNKETFSDLTLVCGGQFYQVHRLVVSSCSEYFHSILEHTPCQHPAVVLQDLLPRHLEALLSYMYLGQVSVPQEDLGGLIKAAECLAIKGLAVPDDASSSPQQEPHAHPAAAQGERPPHPKRCRQDSEGSSPALPAQGNDYAAEDQREARRSRESTHQREARRILGSSSASPQPGSSTFPAQQQHTLLGETPVIKIEEEEREDMKCEEDNDLMLPDPRTGLAGQQEGSQGEVGHALYSPALSGSDSSSVLSQYPAHPESFEEMSQALPGTSGMDRDTGQGWEDIRGKAAFPLDTFTAQQEAPAHTHHTPFHQRELSLALRLQGRTQQDTTTTTPPTTPISPNTVMPLMLPPCSVLGEGVGEGGGRPWREWCCDFPGCGYVTERQSWLRQHMRKHTGEKPFACPICSFRSAQKGNVNVHIKRVHNGGVMSASPSAMPPPPPPPSSSGTAVT